MNFKEKKLYHQVHPIKLGTDISFSIITLYLFWKHQFLLALILHLKPPIVASLLVMNFLKLQKFKESKLGKYSKRFMTPIYEVLRFLGDVITVVGAWFHLPLLILVGLLVVIFAWLKGIIIKFFPD